MQILAWFCLAKSLSHKHEAVTDKARQLSNLALYLTEYFSFSLVLVGNNGNNFSFHVLGKPQNTIWWIFFRIERLIPTPARSPLTRTLYYFRKSSFFMKPNFRIVCNLSCFIFFFLPKGLK